MIRTEDLSSVLRGGETGLQIFVTEGRPYSGLIRYPLNLRESRTALETRSINWKDSKSKVVPILSLLYEGVEKRLDTI